MEFGSGYANAMDRDYWGPVAEAHGDGSTTSGSKSAADLGISAADIGMSLGLGPVPNVPAILAKLRTGAKTIELGFMGMGKGSGQGHTAGMYGKKQRQALREAAEANRMDFTTHASVGVFGLAGQDRQGNFSREAKQASVHEIQRAIEFAADVSRGGPVVVHTGEFQRPISEAKWNQVDNDGNRQFQSYEEEDKRASYRVVDTRTGKLIAEAMKGRAVSRPEWNQYNKKNDRYGENKGKSYVDDNGKTVTEDDYIDYWGNKIEQRDRVPRFDKDKGEFAIRQLGWDDLKDEAKEFSEDAKRFWHKNKHLTGEAKKEKWKGSKWWKFRDVVSEKEIEVQPEEAYILSTLETNAGNSRGWALQYARDFDNEIKTVAKMRKALKIYQQIEETTDEEEKWRLKKQIPLDQSGLIPPDSKFPSQILERELRMRERGIQQSREASANQWASAKETEETMKHVESAESYALREAYGSYAEAGVYAVKMNEQLEKQGLKKRDIFIGMENLFPESYGAHPDEIIDIIGKSRKIMAQKLQQQLKYSEDKARKVAEDSLKITFDVGHMNMWRKYWKGDPNKTLEDNDKAFDKWMLKTTEKLAKNNMVGHVHLVDNYGYQDEHLAPGEGNTPIVDMMRILKKNGFDGDIIVEPGADYTTDSSGFHSVMKTWRLFGSPIYGVHGGSSSGQKHWGQVQYSHMGAAAPPYFTFRPYAPSEDWSLWSGVPFE
jgi:sugar phosphate isomerase/epimerase